MQHERHFSGFRLDLANEQLWRGEEVVRLRGKTFQVLRYLVARPGQLVTKEALLDGVWGEVTVSDSMPSICIAELRKALGDDPRTPSLIETVHGRGYRFIAQFRPAPVSSGAAAAPASAPLMVGRGEELAQIREWFARASQGSRRVVFVSGEPGIGKTTFARSFLADLASKRLARIGCGQCIEQYGAGEPYMPVLEALTRLAQEPDGDLVVEILRRLAPTWLAQMPALVTPEERSKLQSEMQVATHQRMLREMAEALEALAAEMPLVLLLEDLHWSDFSTLELLSVIARRSEAARLLIIGSYRPVEMLASEHRLRAMKEELELHQQCEELRLKLLSERDVGAYIRLRFAEEDPARSLEQTASMIHRRTEGNPLFMVNVVDYLVEQGSLLGAGKIEAPHTITQMIERNLDRQKPEEQTILEAASVAGAEFSAAAVAAALQQEIGEVESCCARLARHEQFVAPQGAITWPDGTVAAGFRFYHALYQEVFYRRVPAGRCVELHRRIAERQETAWGDRAADIAAELAYHFGRCGDKAKALKYLELAGQRAVAQRAYREADQHYSDALAILQTTPESPERDRRELSLLLALGAAIGATRGYSPAETEAAYTRAKILAERTGGKSLEVLRGLWNAAITRSELRTALALADHFLEIANGIGTPAVLAHAHYVQALPRSLIGDLTGARQHFDQALEQYREEDIINAHISLVPNPGLGSLILSGGNEWALGHPEVARRRVIDAIALARRQNNPYALALVNGLGAREYATQGDFKRSLEASEEAVRLSTELGFRLTNALGKINIAWVRAQTGESEGSADQIREGIAEFDAQNFLLYRSWNLQLLAEVQALTGSVDEALVTVEQALQTNPDELLHRPDALRLHGELQIRSVAGAKAQFELAEQDFREAIQLARDIAAKSYELRATTSLARLLDREGRIDEAWGLLSEIYNWFTEGFDTLSLREARSLLEKLRGKLRRQPAIRLRHR
jgi:DNA-binding winged helix-turn-helix (wHTH) protein/tetratricopeptide (TPR) repeat protein